MAAQDKVTFKQDLTEPVKIRHYEGVVFTGDDCGNLIKVALFDGGAPYSGGGTVSATAVLADGTTFPLTQGSITGNMVSVPLEAGALAVSGLMGLYVKISGNGIICTVLNAIFTVQVTDTGRVPAAMVTTVNELVAAIRDAQDSIPVDLTNLLAAVAPTFSTSTAYSAGAYVWQGGKLYRFTAAHPAGTWTGTDAVTVALGNDVADLKSAFDECFDVTKSNNLINPAEIVLGTIDTDGQPKESTTFRRTDEFIPVIPGETYSFRRLVNIYTYNSNKQFVEKLAVGTSAQTRTFGNNAYYIKATSNVDPAIYRWLLNAGNTLIDEDWVPDVIKLANNVSIQHQIDDTLSESGKAADAKAVGDILDDIKNVSDYNHGPFITKSEDFVSYYTNTLQDFSTEVFDERTIYDYVISKFDDLMALDTGFVTKNSLGLASDSTSTIYEYVIQPHHYIGTTAPISPYCEGKIPVILCNACIHGFEKNSTYALYFFLKDLLTNWKTNSALAAIRSNICFKVIPVSNPYGFNNDIYYNANNVNINRNFDTPGWTSITGSADQNSGLEPFDQPESRIIRDWVNANKSNTLMFYDIHTNGHYFTTGYGNFNALLARFYADVADNYFKRLANVFTRHIERQTIKLPTIYQTLTPADNEYLGRYQENRTIYGTASTWATYNGVLSMTFEMFNGLNITGTGHVLDLFTADAKKCCSELLGNIIAEVVMEYSDN